MTAHSCRIRWGWLFIMNNQNSWSMVSFCYWKVQHLNSIMICKVWCSIGTGKCWHILPTLQVSPHVIIGCLHVWKNIVVENDLNWRISMLLSLPLYTIWARTITELQLIIYHVDGKSVWTVLVITWNRRDMCRHSGISVLLSYILLQEYHTQYFWGGPCMFPKYTISNPIFLGLHGCAAQN